MQPAPDLAPPPPPPHLEYGAGHLGLNPTCASARPSLTHTLLYTNTDSLSLSLPLTHTSKHAHTHSLIHTNTHEEYTPPSLENPQDWRPAPSLTRGVYYTARTQERCLVASFPFKPDPSTSVFECYVVVLQALHHCLDCFSACRICLPPLPVSSPLTPVSSKSTWSRTASSSESPSPSMNCAVVTQWHLCGFFLHISHTHTQFTRIRTTHIFCSG